MNKSKNINIVILLLLAFYVFLMRFSYSQNEDQGIFISLSGLISNGKNMYLEIFEIKDPLFLGLYGLVFKFFGIAGLFLTDFIWIASAVCFAYLLTDKIFERSNISLLVATIFLLTICGRYYDTYRSVLPVIPFVVLLYLIALRGNYFIAGIIVGIILWLKMPYLIFCVGIVFLFRRYKDFFSTVYGFLLILALGALILLIRGEFLGYLLMVKENFSYAGNFTKYLGRTPGLRGHIESVDGNGSSFIAICIISFMISMYALIARTRLYTNIKLALMVLMCSNIIFLALTAMWVHHLLSLAIFILPAMILLIDIALSINLNLNGFAIKLRSSCIIFFSICITFLLFSVSGTFFPLSPKVPWNEILKNNMKEPPEVASLVDLYHQNVGLERTYARLGANDDLGLGGYLGREWNLVCPRYWQAGQESSSTVALITNCLEQQPNYIVIAPSFYQLTRAAGTYDDFRKMAINILNRDFLCTPVNGRSIAKVCVRKSGLN
jgi:hypothetical protein